MIYYRSDWPEIGLNENTVACSENEIDHFLSGKHFWTHEIDQAGMKLKLCADPNDFESQLYPFPVIDLYLEAILPDNNMNHSFKQMRFQDGLKKGIESLLGYQPLAGAYVSCKLVKDEPLYAALLESGFEPVEHRTIYTCKISDIVHKPLNDFSNKISIKALSAINPEKAESYQKYILNISRNAFSKLLSRHFTDALLFKKLPGIEYIMALMELNFKTVNPELFFIALDNEKNLPCGFSVVGKKPGLGKGVYTQLLSAVDMNYRGQGIYDRFTQKLFAALPPEMLLLNVMHAGNESMELAYKKSGRKHLTDTLVMRKFVHPGR